jgi:dCMP deaminase
MELPNCEDLKLIKFMQLAEFQAKLFSKDTSTQVCALLIAPNSYQQLSSGYNGLPRGVNDHITSRFERPAKYMWTEHAERNAIYNAARRGTPLEDSIVVVNKFPCADCARAIIQIGASSVITTKPDTILHPQWAESWKVSYEMFAEAGIRVMISPTSDS